MLRVLTCIDFEEIGVFLEAGTSFPPFSAYHQRHMTVPHNEAECLAVRSFWVIQVRPFRRHKKKRRLLHFTLKGFVEDRFLRHSSTQCEDPLSDVQLSETVQGQSNLPSLVPKSHG